MHTSCSLCGTKTRSYHHSLSTGLVSALIKAIEYVKRSGHNSFHPAKDLDLSKYEYTNFQKLRFHGLIAHDDTKPAYWLITKRGGQFLRGEIGVPCSVESFKNKVIGHADQLIHIRDLKSTFPSFESQFAYEYPHVGPMVEERSLFENAV